MKYALGVKSQPIFNDWLRGLSIGERARVGLNLCYRFSQATAGASPVNLASSPS